MKLKPGDRIPPIALTTIHGEAITVPDKGSSYVHLQFLRFAGCPVCNFHLHQLAQRAAEIKEAGVHQVLVFHSSRDEMLKYQAQLPFDCIPDPNKWLFREFGVETSLLALLHPAVLWAGIRGILTTRKLYKKAENGIFGLPADFLIDPEGEVIAAQYGSHAYDNWDADQLLHLVSERENPATPPDTTSRRSASPSTTLRFGSSSCGSPIALLVAASIRGSQPPPCPRSP
ncbi:MAG TPA: peroxiredoxin-like family protein [Gemmatimonadales bacterium]|nr:peroxiredoxin-like family protein [Gemmatimonadales bacterium]